jgi:hypothetical protein
VSLQDVQQAYLDNIRVLTSRRRGNPRVDPVAMSCDCVARSMGGDGSPSRGFWQMRQRFLDLFLRVFVVGKFAGEVFLVSGHVEVAVAA